MTPRFDREYGGPTSALIGLTNAQIDAGLAVSIVSTFVAGEKVMATAPTGPVRARYFGIGPCRSPLRWSPDIKTMLRPQIAAADVVHVHGVWEEIQHRTALECQRQGKPYIVRTCGLLDTWCLTHWGLKKKAYLALRLRRDLRRATLIHCTSQFERRNIEALRLGAPAFVEPNGIDRVEFVAPRHPGRFRERHLGGTKDSLLLMLGRLHPVKNIETAIDMLVDLPGVRLAAVGPGDQDYVASLKTRAERQGVHGRVHFVGMLDGAEKLEALADADLLVMPSHHENFGNVVLEALSAGTPVIVSAEVGLGEEVRAGEVGDTAEPSPKAFGAKVAEWLRDPGRLTSAKARIDGFLRGRFEWSAIARRWSEHYAKLLREQNAP